MLEISGIELSLKDSENEDLLKDKIAAGMKITPDAITSFRIIRKSLDARRARPPHWTYTVEISLKNEQDIGLSEEGNWKIRYTGQSEEIRPPLIFKKPSLAPVVVGSGPAGLFAALTLAKSGLPCLILERGRTIEQRVRDVSGFRAGGKFDPESNIHFGEGGAGTFSDGKLTTRIRNPLIGFVKKTLVDMGAPAEILTSAKPHVGTDKLRKVIENFRGELLKHDCDIRFGAKLTDIIVHDGRIEGIVINGKQEVRTGHIILAPGQGSAETYKMLHEYGIELAPKAFAIGVRVEHPQELINRIQYGKWWKEPELPPAEYSLAVKVPDTDRSAYTFCMCPGGEVVCCSSAEGEMVTNGMSPYKRNGPFANSAVVVNIGPGDFSGASPLSGLNFRSYWEQKAFALGGNNFFAPAQKLMDFLADEDSIQIGRCTYRPGIKPARLRDGLPLYVAETLKKGLRQFEKKMPGYITVEASMIGIETRTSSPVRILRGENLQSVNAKGLFPCGEGAGYAGGIMSSALDGIRAAEALLKSLET